MTFIPRFLIERDTVTLKRAVEGAQDSTGGRSTTYTTAARGTRPTTWKCRIQPMSIEEETQYGVRGDRQGIKFLGATNPQVGTQDQIEFTDSESVAHTVKILGRERNLDGQGKEFQVNGEEVSNES